MVQRYYIHKYLPDWLIDKTFDYEVDLYENYSGEWKVWNKKGILISKQNYINEMQVGKYIKYFSKGQKQLEGEFSMDGSERSVGKWIFYHINGNKRYSKTYSKKPPFYINKKRWRNNGIIKSEQNLLNEKPVGVQSLFDKDGNIHKKKYFDKKGIFQKREYFKNNKLIKTDRQE
ncbi:MAG: hypothetical protein COA79_20760 [Planctomycetota bacterium]|nr:MAG: hypothetical protein COA79_20760 [Planctomycetota bacterium]